MKIYATLFGLIFVTPALSATTYNLEELYQQALKNTAAVKNLKISEDIAKQQKKQAYSEILPELSANYTKVWRDNSQNEKAESTYLSLTQPLFQGGAEFHALSIAKRLPEIEKWNRIQTEIKTYTEVAEAYFKVLKHQADLKSLKQQQKTLLGRVKTLQKRARIGRSKKSDVLSAQSNLARILADMALVEIDYNKAMTLLKNLVGLDNLDELVDDRQMFGKSIPNEWEEKLMQSPQVLWTELRLKNAKKYISIETAEFIPSADLEYNQYFKRDSQSSNANVDWDVTLNLSWNLFSGGENITERKIKIYEALKIENELRDLKRNLLNDFKTAKQEFLAQQARVEKLNTALDLSQSNYKEHVRESSQNLVSSLDVLIALDNYLQTQRAFDHQVYEAKIAYIRLKAIAGVRP